MSEETYCFEIGEEGSKGLDILDTLFNQSTQSFLTHAGIRKGMHVLDIGCGSGVMTRWLAEQVGDQGSVTAIDNSENQINACKRYLNNHGIKNVNAICHSAYDIGNLGQSFDLVYCRFVLLHLHRPGDVIRIIYSVLAENGVYAAEEGLVSQAFTYPFSSAWGNERWHNDPVDHDTEAKDRDGNYGIKLFHTMYQTGFRKLTANLFQPVMTTQTEKSVFLSGLPESKRHFLEQGRSDADWEEHVDKIKKIINDDSVLVGFYQSAQVSGVKSDNLN